MPEKLLDLFEGHPAFEQRGRDGVPEQVRIDARRDARERRGFLHNLLDPLWGIRRVADRDKERPRRAIPQIRPEFVRQVGQQGDIALLAALGLRDQQHLLVEIHVKDLQVQNSDTCAPVWNNVLISNPRTPGIRYA